MADFFSGAVGKIYCISHMHPEADKLFDNISDRFFVEFFPYEKIKFFGELENKNSKEDQFVSEIAYKSATDYLNSKNSSSIEEIELLKYLLLIFKISPDRIVTSKEIINVVKKIVPSFTQAVLRQSIQNLRDKAIIIASPQGKYGYKIPNKVDDLIGFYNRYLNSIVPMLSRIKKANDKLKIQTLNKIDILNKIENFNLLQKLIEVTENK